LSPAGPPNRLPGAFRFRSNPPVAMHIESLERRIVRVETALILLTIAAIAVADAWVGRARSLGPLYLVPLSYSALSQRGWVTLGLFLTCVGLRQVFGPLESTGDPWGYFLRDVGIAAVFAVIVWYLHRLGRQRKAFFALARNQRDELAHELKVAAEAQRRLLESSEPPASELDFHAWSDPLKAVGGDYYDLWMPDDGRVIVVLGDVAGKGLPAALLTPALRITVRSIVSRVREPARIVGEVNAALCHSAGSGSFATLFFASLDRASGALAYVNAGHLPGLLVDGAGNVRWLTGGGMPVGLFAGAEYECHTVDLAPADLLVLYTDGIWEAENPAGEELGRDRLARAVLGARSRPAREVVSAVREEWERFRAGARHADDTTVIALRTVGRPRPASPSPDRAPA
jgi:serine phosphatase RsbU (regulator of sigma subunit)